MSQLAISVPAKLVARVNMLSIAVTLEVSHPDNPVPVKLVAEANMEFMFVTLEVSQPDKSCSKAALESNRSRNTNREG